MKGLILICSVCHIIIDEKETTARIAAFTQENEGVQFSHGLCAKCFKTEMVKMESYFGTNASTGIPMPGKRLA